ncbi:MAG: DUF1330 domain-containing protein [Proteobacteria bacterium]|nr:DUF1330 domain-containing protein [Pseudomonadota bacterium]
MAAGYWVAMVDVTDPERYGEYASKTGPALEKYNAKVVIRGGRSETVEGQEFGKTVVLEFPTYEDAVACYHSPEYQSAKKIQEGASVRNIVIVEGE